MNKSTRTQTKPKNHPDGVRKRGEPTQGSSTRPPCYRGAGARSADAPRKGPLLTRGGNDNPVEQTEDGRGGAGCTNPTRDPTRATNTKSKTSNQKTASSKYQIRLNVLGILAIMAVLPLAFALVVAKAGKCTVQLRVKQWLLESTIRLRSDCVGGSQRQIHRSELPPKCSTGIEEDQAEDQEARSRRIVQLLYPSQPAIPLPAQQASTRGIAFPGPSAARHGFSGPDPDL